MRIEKGYAVIAREWKRGDTIELSLPMPVRRVTANPEVAADRGRVALERGPLVYAAEWADNPGGKVRNLVLPDDAPLRAEFQPGLLNGVTVLKGRAVALTLDAAGKVASTGQAFTAIPYYAWANRGRGQMMVWIPNAQASATPAAYPTAATTAKVTVSGRPHGDPGSINDGEQPAGSSGESSDFDWWPEKGARQSVEYAFAKPAAVSECRVYWFDDTGRGAVRVPSSWRLLYKDGNEWKPVESLSPYGVEKDRFNVVTFRPVSTTGMRLEVTMQPDSSAGIRKWNVK
jgi:hypothetical protein